MRALFVALVVANLLLAAYALLTPPPRSPDAGLLDSQLNAGKIAGQALDDQARVPVRAQIQDVSRLEQDFLALAHAES
jgi:hypothetical protein